MFIVPKNTGLMICREIAENYTGKIIEVRGEDVPLIVSKLIKEGKKVIGITGEDLFKDLLLRNRDTGLEILQRIKWKDKNTLFGKPTLCLLGPKGKRLEELGKELRICINSKYKELAKKYCTNRLENKEYRFEKIYVSGSSEEFFSNGVVDLVIDIVYSGESAKKAGLKVYDKLFESDIVVIGGKDDNSKY